MNIYDIAEKAGVSIATVSRVINGNGPVSRKTADRVLGVIEEMGYRPNIFAQGLATNSMRVIGVLTTNICDLYYAAAIHAIEQSARLQGYDILLACTASSVEDKKKHIGFLLDKRVDGIILIGSIFKEERNNAHIVNAALSVPVVLLNSYVEGRGVYSVFCDDAAGTREAFERLASSGRRRIAYIYDVATYSGVRKLEGYREAAGRAVLPALERKAQSGIDGGAEAAEALLAQGGVDGIVCSEDELAVGALKCLARRGAAVPGDVAVIGYNNSLLARCATPELASVDGKVGLLGVYALETMLKVLETGTAAEKTVVLPELIVRRSAEI